MPETYPNPDILAETDWLAEHIGDGELRVVDCDEFPAYQRLHIDGAIGLRHHHYLKEPGDSASGRGIGVNVMPLEQFEGVMSAHGISNETMVIAYDGMGGLYAARLWWALGYYGHSKCKVLNGGFKKWFAEGRQVTTELRHVERGQFKVQDIRNEACATRIDLEAAIGSGDAVIWDVRSEGEHTGRDPRANKRGGHIPGAVHLEWRDLTNRKTDELLPADEIRSKFEALGITPDKKILTH